MSTLRLLWATLALALTSCAATSALPPLTRADTLINAAGLPSVGKLVVRGNVIYQYAAPGGSNSTSQADNRKAGQRQGAAATAPGAQVEQASERGGGVSPWWFVATAIGAVVAWELLKPKFAAWWVRPG